MTEKPENLIPQEPEASTTQGEEEIRIGVYTCGCGGNISDVVDIEKTAEALSHLPNVVVSRTDAAMCSDGGQSLIEEDIKNLGINRVVIGSCKPSLHRQTFRGAISRGGLNPYFYYHVGIREQDSWVHHDRPDEATKKAIRLMTTGVVKARMLEPLEPIRLPAEKHALVIGGGLAGLRSALDMARHGLKVTLVEKTPFLGGRVAQLETVFPTGEAARDMIRTLIDKVTQHPNITIYTYAELVGMSGYVGDYHVKILQHSRGVSDDMADAAIAGCTKEVPDEFNYGLTKRKVVYRAYPGCYPESPAVDWENYEDGCVKVNGETLHLEDQPKTWELTVGGIVMATGFRPYEPYEGEYGYGVLPEVITLPQLIRLIGLTPEGQPLKWQGREVKNLAMVHCVGSRQIEGINKPQPDGKVNDYCSRVCCTAILHTAAELNKRFPGIRIFDLYQDIRTYGRGHEDYYTEASENNVLFLRYHNDELPEVEAAPAGEKQPLIVKVKDYLTWGEELEVPVDLVVLAVGIMPNPIEDLIHMLKISPGTDRFLLEVHPKLRPVETAVPGIVLAGTAQGPMNTQEANAAAAAAAVKISALLGAGSVELEPFVAHVNPEKCDGTGACVEVCAYEDALTLRTVEVDGKMVQRAVVTPANCAGCGACVSACPNRAIDLRGWTLAQYEAMVDAIALGDMPALGG